VVAVKFLSRLVSFGRLSAPEAAEHILDNGDAGKALRTVAGRLKSWS
jgi:hypothetical protein